MNILIFSWRGPGHPCAGGAEESTYQHAKGWVSVGHQVTLFTSYYRGAKTEEVIDRIKIIRQGSQVFGVQIAAFIWYLFKDHPKFDLVIDEFHGIPFFTPLFVKEKKLAIIHEVTKEVWSLNPWPWPLNLIPAFFGTLFEPIIFKFFYNDIHFMTGSNSAKKDLIAWKIPQRNITVIPYGLTVPKIKGYKKDERKTLIFLGVLSKDKGIEDALKIFSILNSSGEDFQFWVIGKGEDRYLNKLKLQTIKLGMNKKVKFWGYVNEEIKFELLGRAFLLINPSAREGWGLVVIEAARVGTPTVGYNVAGLRDSILNNETGLLCDPNPLSATDAVLLLAKDEKKYQMFRKNCFKWSRMFDWKKSSEESLKLIVKLVNV